MRVVHVIARLNNGGPARVLAALIPACAAAGINGAIITGPAPIDEGDLRDELTGAGIAITTIATLTPALDPRRDAQAAWRLWRQLRADPPDVIHTHTAKAGLLGRLVARWLRVPCLHTYHGHVLRGYFGPGLSAAFATFERAVADRSWNHAVSPAVGRDLMRHHIGRRARWSAEPIPIAVESLLRESDPARSSPRPGESSVPTIGFLGRLAPIKRPGLFIASVAALRRWRPVRGLIAGDGPLGPPTRRAARVAGVPIDCVGFVPAADALARMNVLVLTSRNEGFPLAAIEAMAAGVPVVAVPVGGLGDLAARGAIAHCAPTPLAIAALCQRVLDDPVFRQGLVATGRRVAYAHRPASLVNRWVARYRALAPVAG